MNFLVAIIRRGEEDPRGRRYGIVVTVDSSGRGAFYRPSAEEEAVADQIMERIREFSADGIGGTGVCNVLWRVNREEKGNTRSALVTENLYLKAADGAGVEDLQFGRFILDNLSTVFRKVPWQRKTHGVKAGKAAFERKLRKRMERRNGWNDDDPNFGRKGRW